MNTVDLKQLKEQKRTLGKIVHRGAKKAKHTVTLTGPEINHLDGLLNLLDTVQDGIADHGRVELEIAP